MIKARHGWKSMIQLSPSSIPITWSTDMTNTLQHYVWKHWPKVRNQKVAQL